MRKYTKPNAEIAKFNVEDIITASGLVVNASELVGADYDMYQIYSQNSAAPSTNVSVFTW